jgi:hypothetical protein
MRKKKIILHLCADIGSDSRFYQLDNNYEGIRSMIYQEMQKIAQKYSTASNWYKIKKTSHRNWYK